MKIEAANQALDCRANDARHGEHVMKSGNRQEDYT